AEFLVGRAVVNGHRDRGRDFLEQNRRDSGPGIRLLSHKAERAHAARLGQEWEDRKSTRLNSSHVSISYAVFCLKKKKKSKNQSQPDKQSNAHDTAQPLLPFALLRPATPLDTSPQGMHEAARSQLRTGALLSLVK